MLPPVIVVVAGVEAWGWDGGRGAVVVAVVVVVDDGWGGGGVDVRSGVEKEGKEGKMLVVLLLLLV